MITVTMPDAEALRDHLEGLNEAGTSPIAVGIDAEEAGEILGAVLKSELGLKPVSEIAVETAQTVLCAMSLAESVGFDLWAAVAADWETMKTRVWAKS